MQNAKLGTQSWTSKARHAKRSTQSSGRKVEHTKVQHPKLRTQSSACKAAQTRRRQSSTHKTQHPKLHKQQTSDGKPNAQAGELFQACISKRIDLRPHHGATFAGGTFGRDNVRYSNRIVRTSKAEPCWGTMEICNMFGSHKAACAPNHRKRNASATVLK